MIITKLYINNWYSFVDSELDLTYPRKISDSTITYEYLPGFENIRYKRVVILTGANASGKTSLAKIILAIRDFMSNKKICKYFSEGMHQDKEELDFSIEFIDKLPENLIDKEKYDLDNYYNYIQLLNVRFFPLDESKMQLRYKFTYKAIEIKKTDNIDKLRKILNEIDGEKINKSRNQMYLSNLNEDYLSEKSKKQLFEFENLKFSGGWNFRYSDLSDENKLNYSGSCSKDILFSVLKTFDPSIIGVNEVFEEGESESNGFFINFHNKDKIYLSKDGAVSPEKKHLLSLGTYDGIKIAHFVSDVIKTKGYSGVTLFLDEGMSHVQSEIERAVVALIIEKMNKYSQFFYTTHNYDVLDMNLPIHSYLFIKKDENHNSFFIKAEDHFNKNDRSIINYVKNDVLCTLPDTHLIDEIMMQD